MISPEYARTMARYNEGMNGQLTTLLMQRGIDPGVTDLIRLPR
jgi:hypothetical protein